MKNITRDQIWTSTERQESALSAAQKEMKILPEQLLKISKIGGRLSYKMLTFVPEELRKNKKTKYLEKTINSNPELIKQLCRKTYLAEAISRYQNNLPLLNALSCTYESVEPEDIIESLGKWHREVPPEYFLIPTNTDSNADDDFWDGLDLYDEYNSSLRNRSDAMEDLALLYSKQDLKAKLERHADWANAPYIMSDFRPEDKKHTTARGLKVRSRAELSIADRLDYYEIPYRYEQVLTVGNIRKVPDFTFEDYFRKEFYLEYNGLMNDAGYRRDFIQKRSDYESIGINQWTNMIYIFEEHEALDIWNIDQLIKNQIIPRL